MRKLVLVLVAAVVTACGGSSTTGTTGGTNTTTPPTTGTPTATTSVVIQNVAFTPSSIVVPSGSVVSFTNNDNITHNVTFDNATVGTSGNFSSGVKTLTMPSTAGVYNFKCTIHGTMTGTVTVQ